MYLANSETTAGVQPAKTGARFTSSTMSVNSLVTTVNPSLTETRTKFELGPWLSEGVQRNTEPSSDAPRGPDSNRKDKLDSGSCE